MKIFVGTSGFSYPAWKGKFYPRDLPASELLPFYAARFPTVEINNTFYRTPAAETVERWAAQVPESFRFVLKAPQEITHRERLRGSSRTLAGFVRAAASLGARKGPFLFQLPPFFRVDVQLLSSFLALLPGTERATFEFRHPSWFCEETYAALRAHQAALCIADAEKLSTPFVATASWGYLRLRDVDYDDDALRRWAAQIQSQAWDEAFVFFKHEDAGRGPMLGARLMEILGV